MRSADTLSRSITLSGGAVLKNRFAKSAMSETLGAGWSRSDHHGQRHGGFATNRRTTQCGGGRRARSGPAATLGLGGNKPGRSHLDAAQSSGQADSENARYGRYPVAVGGAVRSRAGVLFQDAAGHERGGNPGRHSAFRRHRHHCEKSRLYRGSDSRRSRLSGESVPVRESQPAHGSVGRRAGKPDAFPAGGVPRHSPKCGNGLSRQHQAQQRRLSARRVQRG